MARITKITTPAPKPKTAEPLLKDLKDMPNFNPSVKNGLTSVSEGKIFWTSNNLVTCIKHGACLCVNEARTIWRCPTCHEGCYVEWEQKEPPKTTNQINREAGITIHQYSSMLQREAEASCRLDGDTMDCTKCKSRIEKETAQKIFSHIRSVEIINNGCDAQLTLSVDFLKRIKQYPIKLGGSNLKKGLE